MSDIVKRLHTAVRQKYHEVSQFNFENSKFAIYMTQDAYRDYLDNIDSSTCFVTNSNGSEFPQVQFLGCPVFVVLQTNDKAHKDFEVVITELKP